MHVCVCVNDRANQNVCKAVQSFFLHVNVLLCVWECMHRDLWIMSVHVGFKRLCVCARICVCRPRRHFASWAVLVTGSDWQLSSPPPPFTLPRLFLMPVTLANQQSDLTAFLTHTHTHRHTFTNFKPKACYQHQASSGSFFFFFLNI